MFQAFYLSVIKMYKYQKAITRNDGKSFIQAFSHAVWHKIATNRN
jgi:hypothetical protein